jgi:hypothetical protein
MIKWSDIETECGDYRAGFVATFRKYEAQPTDEKDAQGRPVKVTMASFARHMGVSQRTFYDWVRNAVHTPPAYSKTADGIDERKAKSLVRNKPQMIVEAVSELPEESQREIVRQLHQKQLERAGADFSEKGRKERGARTAEHFDPLRRSLNAMKVVATLEKAAEELRHLPADLTEKDHRDIDAAVDDVILARTEMHMRNEVGS